jgi:hypothetical protein
MRRLRLPAILFGLAPLVHALDTATIASAADTVRSSRIADSAAKAPDAAAIAEAPVARSWQPPPMRDSNVVATLYFANDEIDDNALLAATGRFEKVLSDTGHFQVLDRAVVDSLLGAQDCDSCSNASKGVALGVQSIFSGNFTRRGNAWRLSVDRTESATGRPLFHRDLDIYGSQADALRRGSVEMARLACDYRRKKEEPPPPPPLATGKRPLWPWIAGGSAVAVGATVAAILLTSSDKTTHTPTSTSLVEFVQP